MTLAELHHELLNPSVLSLNECPAILPLFAEICCSYDCDQVATLEDIRDAMGQYEDHATEYMEQSVRVSSMPHYDVRAIREMYATSGVDVEKAMFYGSSQPCHTLVRDLRLMFYNVSIVNVPLQLKEREEERTRMLEIALLYREFYFRVLQYPPAFHGMDMCEVDGVNHAIRDTILELSEQYKEIGAEHDAERENHAQDKAEPLSNGE